MKEVVFSHDDAVESPVPHLESSGVSDVAFFVVFADVFFDDTFVFGVTACHEGEELVSVSVWSAEVIT